MERQLWRVTMEGQLLRGDYGGDYGGETMEGLDYGGDNYGGA